MCDLSAFLLRRGQTESLGIVRLIAFSIFSKGIKLIPLTAQELAHYKQDSLITNSA